MTTTFDIKLVWANGKYFTKLSLWWQKEVYTRDIIKFIPVDIFKTWLKFPLVFSKKVTRTGFKISKKTLKQIVNKVRKYRGLNALKNNGNNQTQLFNTK